MDDLLTQLTEGAEFAGWLAQPRLATLLRDAAGEIGRLRTDLARWEGAFGRLKDRVAAVAAPPLEAEQHLKGG